MLGIHLPLTVISLSDTISILELFGIDRARPTVHNWVHKADLQLEDRQSPDHIGLKRL